MQSSGHRDSHLPFSNADDLPNKSLFCCERIIFLKQFAVEWMVERDCRGSEITYFHLYHNQFPFRIGFAIKCKIKCDFVADEREAEKPV